MPGLQFFQNMAQPTMQSMGSSSPLTAWATPTLDPQELDKKIQDLKTVQFWLEQNVRALTATIQAMEVQKLTLQTLQGMNVSLQEVAQSFQNAMPSMAAAPASVAPQPEPAVAPPTEEAAARVTAAPVPPGMDPMQWWGSLSQQFQQIAKAAAAVTPAASAPVSTAEPESAKAPLASAKPKRAAPRKPAA